MENLFVIVNGNIQDFYLKVQQRLEIAEQYRTIFINNESLAFKGAEEFKVKYFYELDKFIKVLKESLDQLEIQLTKKYPIIKFDDEDAFISFHSADTVLGKLKEHIELIKRLDTINKGKEDYSLVQ